jgi:hypothetical protein
MGLEVRDKCYNASEGIGETEISRPGQCIDVNPMENQMRTTPPKDKAIRLRVSQSDRSQIQQAAMKLGLSMSDFILSNSLAVCKQVQTDV